MEHFHQSWWRSELKELLEIDIQNRNCGLIEGFHLVVKVNFRPLAVG